MIDVDLSHTSRRDLNARLHALLTVTNETLWRVANPAGQHALAVGIAAPITVEIDGNVGYYCGGMNAAAEIIVHGNAGVGVAENMMSGSVRVHGDASQAAGATSLEQLSTVVNRWGIPNRVEV